MGKDNKQSNKYWSKSDAYKWSRWGHEGQQGSGLLILCQVAGDGLSEALTEGRKVGRWKVQRKQEGSYFCTEGGRAERQWGGRKEEWDGCPEQTVGGRPPGALCPRGVHRYWKGPWGLHWQLLPWRRWHLPGHSGLLSPRPLKGKTQVSSLLASQGHLNSLGKADWGGGKWWPFGYVEFEFPKGGPRGMVYVGICSSGKTWKWIRVMCSLVTVSCGEVRGHQRRKERRRGLTSAQGNYRHFRQGKNKQACKKSEEESWGAGETWHHRSQKRRDSSRRQGWGLLWPSSG